MNRWTVLIALLLGWLGVIGYGMGLFGDKDAIKALPDWDIGSMCSGVSDPDACNKLEIAAQKSVSDTWDLLPDNYRSACIDDMNSSKDQSFRALAKCLAKQAANGGSQEKATAAATTPSSDNSTDQAVGSDALSALLAERASWGTGPEPTVVEAPLAAGAVSPLPKSTGRVEQAGPGADTIVHEVVITPAPDLTPVPQDQINSAMAALLQERASWGTEPSTPKLTIAEAMQALLSERASWGTGPEPTVVEAPLAAGAVSPLPASGGRVEQAGPGPNTIVHDAVITPAPDLTPVPQDQINSAMEALLKERASWGTEPSERAAKPADPLEALFAERASWGTGPEPTVVEAPLAAGVVTPLPASGGRVEQAGPGPNTIVYEAVITPAPDLTPVPQDQINSAMEALLKERASWGTEPSERAAKPADPLEALLSERASWGTGPEPTVVEAPLAAGAVSPLPASGGRVEQAGPGPNTIVHDAVITPAPDLTPVPQDQINSAMEALLKERASWGTEPSERAAKPADPLEALFAERASWGTGPEPTVVEAPLAAGSVTPLPASGGRVEQAGPGPNTIVHDAVITPAPDLTPVPQDQINSAMVALLQERASWGTAPGAVAAKPIDPLEALFAERASWGTGPEPTVVEAPLAAGAVSPLPASGGRVEQAGPGPNTIVHEAVITPAPVLSPVPQDQINSAMVALLQERASWGVAPSAVAAGSCQTDLRKIARSGVIRFSSGSAKLSGTSNATLDKIAAKAKQCRGLSIQVEGHTDSTGSAMANKRISQARAESVVEYLKKAGVDAGQLNAVGFGSSKPVASNKTKASRRKNRRIDFSVGTRS